MESLTLFRFESRLKRTICDSQPYGGVAVILRTSNVHWFVSHDSEFANIKRIATCCDTDLSLDHASTVVPIFRTKCKSILCYDTVWTHFACIFSGHDLRFYKINDITLFFDFTLND